jgi:hypothetical protein
MDKKRKGKMERRIENKKERWKGRWKEEIKKGGNKERQNKIKSAILSRWPAVSLPQYFTA